MFFSALLIFHFLVVVVVVDTAHRKTAAATPVANRLVFVNGFARQPVLGLRPPLSQYERARPTTRHVAHVVDETAL